MTFRYRTDQLVEPGDYLVNDDTGNVWRVLAAREVNPRDSEPRSHRYVWACTTERVREPQRIRQAGVTWHSFVRDRR